ncbi:MAG TPA: protein-disulfide reductase DsbD domain-containing protein, partial [Tepidisphaeraceae bacterium]|nr:protein-disulfide reductase DsbD domain-containing protein [Tepidisphaeraceae bacterium]
AVFAEQLESNGEGMSSMVEAAIVYLRKDKPFTVSAQRGAQQDRPLSPQEIAAGVVTIASEWLDPKQLKLKLHILPGFHINAHEAAKDLIATHVMVDPPHLVEATDYAPGELQRFAFAEAPIRVYTGEASIAIRFKQALTKESQLRVAIQYQACDDSACLPPVRKQVSVSSL